MEITTALTCRPDRVIAAQLDKNIGQPWRDVRFSLRRGYPQCNGVDKSVWCIRILWIYQSIATELEKGMVLPRYGVVAMTILL